MNLNLLVDNLSPNENTPPENFPQQKQQIKRMISTKDSFNFSQKKMKMGSQETIEEMAKKINHLQLQVSLLCKEFKSYNHRFDEFTSPNKILGYEEIEKKREWKVITSNQQAIGKFNREFNVVQKAKRPSGCPSFGLSEETFVERKIDVGINWASVASSSSSDNQDYASEGEVLLRPRFAEEIKMPYWMVCDGHGLQGKHASKFVAEKYPQILAKNLVEYNPEKWTDKGILNAMKVSCKEMDDLFVDGYSGGSTMDCCFVLDGDVYFGSVGDSPGLILNGGEAIPMTRDANTKDEKFVRSVEKRGGVVVEGRVGVVKNGMVKKIINITRSFGNKIPELKGETNNHKVLTPRCKATRFAVSKLEKDHFIVLYSDGVAGVANPQQLNENIRKHEKTTDCEKGYAPLCEKVLRDILLTKERKKDDCTLVIFRIADLK